ncbi:hypothetical protein PTSG_05451 [Salpingoeca rosetta]|uniref:AP-3 complex subunit delta n=1 Tax=Salpingoeca rosetta (strain ATCC 50818 / BSB-021) TaxID=946362 RepID=F2UB91_SALR5|nr:uncharacterized protein PTSG_05451 [Salpingoeca rosetta]EGD73757.1 hypothetical protein PTSG_05451 [Salpingoeca rosetta]|eukprot:XP_004993320.1 hypothetical protein PTSG_05451 [Salpingoeca rosetta]
MFEKTLGDLIRGIRSHPDDEAKYISSCMDEIRKELAQPDLDIKANALAKLTYLQMLGYDMSWAAFHVVEVMTSKKYAHKRIGFLAAAQSFHDNTDVLMLTTNMLKKSLTSHNQYESGLALNGLSNFIRDDLARDLASDLISLLTSVRPYVRKRATLVMYKLFLKYPDALRAAFPKLKDKLEDEDPGVQAAAVNVICELARKNPKNYLSLAPTFFKLLTTSTNNWLRIKIVKLFAALCPLEPRLGRKLVEPLTELIHGTPATSLLYECINTVLAGIPDHTATIQLCVQKLRIFIEDSDQNLKYLGLQAMASVLKIAPKAVLPHRDLVIECLDDDDESIRLRALDLLAGMVTKKTLIDIVRRLLQHLERTEGQTYRDEVVAKIIQMCSQSTYQYITNFEWYVQVLVQLTRVENTRHGALIRDQLMDVAIRARVKVLRPFACKQMAALLTDQRLYSGHNIECGISEVLYAAAWISGEFSEHLDTPTATTVVEALLQPRTAQLPGPIQAVFIHNCLKVYAADETATAANGDDDGDGDDGAVRDSEDLQAMRGVLTARLPLFVQSGDLEVQERAVLVSQIVAFVEADLAKGHHPHKELAALYAGNLNPVAAKAQRKVPVPENVDLDRWINTPPASEDEEEDRDLFSDAIFAGVSEKATPLASRYESDDEEDLRRRRQVRMAAQAANPYHLGQYATPSGGTTSMASSQQISQEEVDQIPVRTLDLGPSIKLDVAPVPGTGLDFGVEDDTEKKKKKDKKKRKKKRKKLSKKEIRRLKKKGLPIPEGPPSSSDEDDDDHHRAAAAKIDILAQEDMPEGAEESGGDEEPAVDDPHAALNIDLEAAGEFELPKPSHYDAMTAHTHADSDDQDKKKKKKKDKKKRKKKSKKTKEVEPAGDEPVEAPKVDVGDIAGETTVDAPPAEEQSALDSWLSEDKPKAAEKKDKKDKKDKKKSKKDKKKKKKKAKKEKGAESAVETAAADEASAAPPSPPIAPVLHPLLKDDTVAVAYQLNATSGAVRLQFVVKNHAAGAITDVALTPADDSEAKPDGSGPVSVSSSLAGGAAETAEIVLPITDDARETSFKATLTYACAGGVAEQAQAEEAIKEEEGKEEDKHSAEDEEDGDKEEREKKDGEEGEAEMAGDEQTEAGEDKEDAGDAGDAGEGVATEDTKEGQEEEEMNKEENEGDEGEGSTTTAATDEEPAATTATASSSSNVITKEILVRIPVSDLLLTKPCTQEEFRALLEDGGLSPSSSLTLNKQGVTFEAAAATVCSIVHGQVVEMIAGAASIYSATVADGHVCLQIVDQDESVNIDAKCSSQELTTALLADLEARLS